MSTLMLVSNPSKTKGRKKMATRRKPRTAAQKAATRKLVASNRARKAPVRRRRRTVASAAKSVRRYARTSVRRAGSAVRRYRRSSTHRGGFGIVNLLKQAGLGAVGAVAVDIVYSKLPIPAQFKDGNTGALVKAGVTVALGIAAGKVLNKATAHNATVGALTVQLASILKNFAAGAGLAGYTDINGVEYYSPATVAGADDLGLYLSANETGVGEYVSGYDTVEAVY